MTQALISQFLIGFSVAAILVIGAIGLAVIFGVAGVINMAHGQFIMVGAYTAAVVGQLGGNTFLAINHWSDINAQVLLSSSASDQQRPQFTDRLLRTIGRYLARRHVFLLKFGNGSIQSVGKTYFSVRLASNRPIFIDR